jgi:hypothetical protein
MESKKDKPIQVYHFMPFSLKWDFADEINKYIQLVPNDDDWICIYDGDVIFTRPNWGTEIAEMIKANPKFDLLTCLTTRMSIKDQQLNNEMSEDIDLINLHLKCENQFNNTPNYKAKETKTPIAGYFLCFKKKLAIQFPLMSSDTGMLWVDVNWTKKLLDNGKKIGVCQKIAIIHWYRLYQGVGNDSHLIQKRKVFMVSKVDKTLVIPPKMKNIFPNEKEMVIKFTAGVPVEVPTYVLNYYTKNRPQVFSRAKDTI